MVQRHIKAALFLVTIIFLLSGCAEKFSALSKLNIIDFIDNSDSTTETPPPELRPIPSETEMCLTQELDQLSKTGSWVDSTESQGSVLPETPHNAFPVIINKQVSMYLTLFQSKQRNQLRRWLGRSGIYLPMMEKELKKAGLPEDLVYLSMIESGYSQRAYSSARAMGLWQFMKGTGRDYHLKVDKYVDERRDAEKSTKAAVAYLADLYKQFGDWHLAVAAYNAGPGKIRYGLKKYKVKTFWELAEKRYLTLETKRYVPKLIAAILISKNLNKYGFTNISYKQPLTYDQLEVGPGLSLNAVALISGSTSKKIQFLNQELKTGKTPLNQPKYLVKIPSGTQHLASNNISRLHSIVNTGYKTHIIRKNESLSAICRKYNINKTTLLKVNNLHNGKLAVGKRLRIPYNTIHYQLLPKNTKALAYSKDSLILHKIKPGETVSKISKRYNVPPELIVSWNGLPSVHKIRAGQQIALYITRHTSSSKLLIASKKKTTGTTKIIQSTPSNVMVLAGSKKRSPSKKGIKPHYHWYQVKNGDTLWTISRKFKTSPHRIKKLNNLKNNLIHPGNKLKIKAA